MNYRDDIVYITLLEYNEERMPSYVKLAEDTGLSRQTVSRRVARLIEEGVLTVEDNIVFIEKEFNTEPSGARKKLEKDKFSTEAEIARLEKIEQLLMPQSPVIYAIVFDGVVKYVGVTKHFSARKGQHMRKRPFLQDSNFIILKYCGLGPSFEHERQLIKLLQPEWNIMSKG